MAYVSDARGKKYSDVRKIKVTPFTHDGGSGGVCVAGQEVVPGSGVARAVFGVFWVSSVILYAAYTSNLVSHFTVTR